jgi:hypothetical protein
MSRKGDLESHIRESYGIVREYEDLIRTSDRPEEKLRARRAIEGQWALIEGYLEEYRRLAGGAWPPDLVEIAAHFQGGSAPPPRAPGGRERPLFDQRGQHVERQINVAGDYYAGEAPAGSTPDRGATVQAPGEVPAGWSRRAVRRLLLNAFDDTELATLCFDHFDEVHRELTSGMSKGQMVQLLLEHCVRRERVGELLGLVRERNPVQYERYRLRGEGEG